MKLFMKLLFTNIFIQFKMINSRILIEKLQFKDIQIKLSFKKLQFKEKDNLEEIII